MTESFGVSVVVPVYNCADVLPTTIATLTGYFAREFLRYELIFVDDCSIDESSVLLRDAAAENQNIRVLVHESNQGQQQTLVEGSLSALNEIVIAVDADLPCELSDLKKIAHLAHDGIELVLARRTGGFNRAWWRSLGSQVANLFFGVLYPFKIKDFGCGIAAARRSLLEKLRVSGRRVRLIKLDLLYLADNYVEIEIHVPPTHPTGKSSYSFSKLLRLLWTVFTYRFQQ